MGLFAAVEYTAAAADRDDLGVGACHPVTPHREIARQHRRPVGQHVLLAAGAATPKPRPLPIPKGEHMRLLPDAADAPTGEHRRRRVAVHLDRHRGKASPAAQPPDGLHASRLDQGNALCQAS